MLKGKFIAKNVYIKNIPCKYTNFISAGTVEIRTNEIQNYKREQ